MKIEFQLKDADFAGGEAGRIAAILEAAFVGLKLHADTETDTVHGSVTIGGKTCVIEFYDIDELPAGSRKSTLKSFASKPNSGQIVSALKAAGKVL